MMIPRAASPSLRRRRSLARQRAGARGRRPGRCRHWHRSPDAQLARPTLADLGERGLRWGTLLVSALAGAAALGIAAWFARLVSAALVREDWLGWTTLGLLLLAALAAVMLLRLARDHRLLAPRPPASPQDRRGGRPARPKPAPRAQGRPPSRRSLRQSTAARARRAPLPRACARRARSRRAAGPGRSRHRRPARRGGARAHHPVRLLNASRPSRPCRRWC